MSTLIDSYSEANGSVYYVLIPTYGFLSVGQSFHNIEQMTLNSCKFYLNKYGSPSGNMYALLYAHSGTFGSSSVATGSVLATSSPINANTVSGAGLIEFTFDGSYKMSPDTNYVILCNFNNGDVDNYIMVGVDNSLPVEHEGNVVTNDGSWGYDSAVDCLFYVYGTLQNPTISGISTIQGISTITL